MRFPPSRSLRAALRSTPSPRPALREQPSDDGGRPVGRVPDKVIRPKRLKILNGRADGREGRRGLARLLNGNDVINLAMDNPGGDAPELPSKGVEGRSAICWDDRPDRGPERCDVAADRDEAGAARRKAIGHA